MASTRTAARAARTARRPAAPAAAPVAQAVVDPGFITVRIGKLPGIIQTIALNGGRTVKDALEGAGLGADGHELKVQGVAATLQTALKQDDTVLLVRKIRGNW